MKTKLGNFVGIDPKCKQEHDLDEANVFQNEYQQRYFEWPCGCTQVYSAMARPKKEPMTSGIAKGVQYSDFVKGLFKSEFDY